MYCKSLISTNTMVDFTADWMPAHKWGYSIGWNMCGSHILKMPFLIERYGAYCTWCVLICNLRTEVYSPAEKLFDWTLDLTCQWITLLASSFSTGKLVRAMSALVSCCDTVPAHTSPAQCGRYCESGSTCFCSRSARASCQVTSLLSWWQQTQQQQRRHPSPGPPHLPPAACCQVAPAEDPEVRPPGCFSLRGLLIRQMSPSIHFVCVKSTEDCVCIMEQSHFTSILRIFLPCPIRLNLSLPCVSWCGATCGLVVGFFVQLCPPNSRSQPIETQIHCV